MDTRQARPSVRGVAWPTAGLLAVAVAAYWPSAAALWGYWSDQPYEGGHGPIVVGLAIWLLYRSRHRLAQAAVHPMTSALPLVVLCSVASVLFWRAGIQALQLLMLPALMLAAVLAAFGLAVARIVSVPIGFLYFAMPAWNLLSHTLQALTVKVMSILAPVTGLPATFHGAQISFPSGATFIVTPGCGGVGFLVQGLAVATLLGELEQAPVARRVRLLAAMVVVALVGNWIRVLALLHIGYSTNMRHVLVSRDHLEFGWVLFVIVLVAFVWLATRRPLPAQSERSPLHPVPRVISRHAYFTAVCALAATPLLVGVVFPVAVRGSEAAQLSLPSGRDGWGGPFAVTDATWTPEFVGEHTLQRAMYQDSHARAVEVVAVGYTMQEQGRELVNEDNSLLGSGGLTVVSSSIVEVQGIQYWELVTLDGQEQRSIIWCLYDIGGRPFVIPILSQLWYGARALVAPPYSALWALRTSCAGTCETARATLTEFARGMGDTLVEAAASRMSRSTKSAAGRA